MLPVRARLLPAPTVTELDDQMRRYGFVFQSRVFDGVRYTVTLLDRVTIEARVLKITHAPHHCLAGDLITHDVLVGWGTVARDFESLCDWIGDPWHEFPTRGELEGARMGFWENPRLGLSLVTPGIEAANLHMPALPSGVAVGDTVLLDGVSCQVVIAGHESHKKLSSARRSGRQDCFSFWPSYLDIESVCDDVVVLDSDVVQTLVEEADPELYQLRRYFESKRQARVARGEPASRLSASAARCLNATAINAES